MEILLLLGAPLAGGAVLALLGNRRWAPEAGVVASLITFLTALALTVQVIRGGPLLALAMIATTILAAIGLAMPRRETTVLASGTFTVLAILVHLLLGA